MSTTATETRTETVLTTQVEAAPAPAPATEAAPATAYPTPLEPTGALDQFQFEESTTVIGREYPTVNIVDDILKAKNADDLLRDLAITSRSPPLVYLF